MPRCTAGRARYAASAWPRAVQRREPHGVWGGEIFDRGRIIAEKRPRRPSSRGPASERVTPLVQGDAGPAWRNASQGFLRNGGTDALWFAAGINHEQNGLLGVLRP